MSNICFFQCRILFFPGISLQAFFPSKSVCRIFFFVWNHPAITPLKVKWLAPKIHQTFALLTDSDLSIISKALWNSRGQNSLGERGGIHFYLPLPGESIRMYVDVITKFSQMDSLPNFLSYGATLALGLCTLMGSAMTYSVQLILYLVPLYFHFVLWIPNTMYNKVGSVYPWTFTIDPLLIQIGREYFIKLVKY